MGQKGIACPESAGKELMVSVGFGCDLSFLPHSPPVLQTVPGFANPEEIIAAEKL